MARKVISTADLATDGNMPLAHCLARLGFSGYEIQIERALQKCDAAMPLTSRQVLVEVLTAIIDTRDAQKAAMRTKMARFPVQTQTLKTFDFSRLTDKLVEAKIRELASCDWVRCHSNLYFHGSPGLGKTHLSIALGIRATQQAYSTLFIAAKDLFAALNTALRSGTYESKLNAIQRNEVLIIDDLSNAVVPRPENAMIFYDLLDGRQGRKSTVITSNREMIDWIKVLGGDKTCMRAAMDRFLDNCHDFQLQGKSYRLTRFLEQRRKDWGPQGSGTDSNGHRDTVGELAEILE